MITTALIIKTMPYVIGLKIITSVLDIATAYAKSKFIKGE